MILSKHNIKSVDIDHEINVKIKSERFDQLLLIVPTNRKIRSLKKELISVLPNKAAGRLNLETIGTLSTNLLFIDAYRQSYVLSEAASAVLLNQSFLKTKLKYFSNYRAEIPTGTLSRIKNVISEYKKHGITSETLKNEAQTLSGSEKTKAEDIADIYKIYNKLCGSLGVKEIGDIYSELNKKNKTEFEAEFRELYPKVDLVVVNGFDEFTLPEIEIINSLSEITNCRLFISFDYFKYNPLIFSYLDNCYNKLIEKGFKTVTDISPLSLNRFQSVIKENLFKYEHTNKVEAFKSSITKIKASGREKEVELIAKEIKKIISEKEVEPHKICVAYNLISKYTPFVRDIFFVYGIPFNLTDRFLLSNSLPVTSIINFFEILENDFYYKNIFRALSSGYLNIDGINSSNLLKASINLKIISGYENWRNKLKDAVLPVSGSNGYSITPAERDLYNKALIDIEHLYEELSPFDKKMTIRDFLNELQSFILKLNIPANLINRYNETIEKDVKALTTFIEETTELLELLKKEYGTKEKFALSFFLNNIRTAVISSRYNIKEKPDYGVQVTTLNEIRGLQFDYLFISGLCDGDFPTRYTPEIFFSGSYARSERLHQTQERYHFYQALCSWKKQLYLTYPAAEEKKELLESNFLTEFTNVFAVRNKTELDYAELVYSPEELMIYIGQKGSRLVKKNIEQQNRTVEINYEKIDRSIEINQKRIKEPLGKSEYTGFIKDSLSDTAMNKLENFSSKQFSISQLETFAKCPYKYFAERVLKLEPPKEPTEEIEALEMGSLLHEILYEFYKKIREKGIVLSAADNVQFNQAANLLFKIAGDKIENVNFNSSLAFYEREKILGIAGNRTNSILYKFLNEERNSVDGFIPEYFELEFGRLNDDTNGDSILTQLKINETSVRGKIDRIDLNSRNNTFKVIDYKLSGSKPSAQDLANGLSLQLPLYMFAAKHLIKTQLDKDFAPIEANIYSLKFNKKEFGKNLITTLNLRKKITDEQKINANEELIQICMDAIELYVKEISEGRFNLSTLKDRENKICRYCSFRSICRIQEVK